MRRSILLFYTFYIPFNLIARPPLEEISKTSINDPQYSHLSPIYGAEGAEEGSLKDILLKENENNAHYNLLKLLFFIEEGGEFVATAYQPYTTFTPTTISLLICKACDNSLFELNKDNKYCAIEKLTETYSGANSPKRIHSLIKLIDESMRKENKTTFKILLAFLYLQSNSTDELQEYTKLTCDYLNIHRTAIGDDSETLQPNAEQATLKKLLEKKVHGYRPPTLHWRRNIKYGSNKPVSNCCETAVNAILNNMLFNRITQSFNLSLLQEYPELLSFYTKHTKAENLSHVDSQEVHEDWMEVVSGLHAIEYRKGHYEIEPGIFNILNCIAALFKMPQEKSNYTSEEQALKGICEKISQKTLPSIIKPLTFSLQENDKGDVQFEILTGDLEYPSYPLTLCVRKNHAWIVY